MMLVRQFDSTRDACILINVERVATWFVRCFEEGCVITVAPNTDRDTKSQFRVSPKMEYEPACDALSELGLIVTSGESGVVSWDTDGWVVDTDTVDDTDG